MHKLQIKMTAEKRRELADKQALTGQQVVKVKNKNGVRKVSGGKDLKKTQEYPSSFGHRVAQLHTEWKEPWLSFAVQIW